ncbi:MAG: hypothetical protein JRH11_18350 [Deltaproteobacteria bacterium]|nr:hypothetical protein [Deltaproteobacteria bacterium]
MSCSARVDADGPAVTCGTGQRHCLGGTWSGCEITETRTVIESHALVGGPAQCDVCHPDCAVTVDYPTNGDLTAGNSDGVVYDPLVGGVTLTPTIDPPESEGCIGPGATCDPYDPDAPGASGVATVGGALVIADPGISPPTGSVWVSNTKQGTVSRFDHTTFEETGRFYTCPDMSKNCDPSRTTVNTRGDAFVANRAYASIVRISNLGTSCPDTNGDGVITTSTDGTLLAWGEDDCVLWHRDLAAVGVIAKVRAAAAQDITDPVSGELVEHVWVGSHDATKAVKVKKAKAGDPPPPPPPPPTPNRVAQLDGDGNVLLVRDLPNGAYGMALDRSQNLWILQKDQTAGVLMRLDTTRCNAVDGCPANPFTCTSGWGSANNCDAAVGEVISVPYTGYGLTVDIEQRVWFNRERVTSYDRREPIGSRFRYSDAGIGGQGGVAADANGWIWACGKDYSFRVEADDPTNAVVLPLDTACRGAGIDGDGKVWFIPNSEDWAVILTPGVDIADNPYVIDAEEVIGPYMYSDFTGQQLRLASTLRGFYYETFEGCTDGGPTEWRDLAWDATVPTDTRVVFRIKTAATAAGLGAQPWTTVALLPTDVSPIFRDTVLRAASITGQRYLQLEIMLESEHDGLAALVTPEIRTVTVGSDCDAPPLEPGSYTNTYDAADFCTMPPQRPDWYTLDYRVSTPSDSSIVFEFRTASTVAGLGSATPVTYSMPPRPDVGSFDVGDLLVAAGVSNNEQYLRLSANMLPSSDGTTAPVLMGFSQSWLCQDLE